MCWRIVRISGDGSIKLILEDQYAICNDVEDIDGDGTEDYKFTGNWNIGLGNYGYDSTSKSASGSKISKLNLFQLKLLCNSIPCDLASLSFI